MPIYNSMEKSESYRFPSNDGVVAMFFKQDTKDLHRERKRIWNGLFSPSGHVVPIRCPDLTLTAFVLTLALRSWFPPSNSGRGSCYNASNVDKPSMVESSTSQRHSITGLMTLR